MPTTNFEPQKPKLVYLSVKQMGVVYIRIGVDWRGMQQFALPASKLILAFGVQIL